MFKKAMFVMTATTAAIFCTGCDWYNLLYTTGALGGVTQLINNIGDLFGVNIF